VPRLAVNEACAAFAAIRSVAGRQAQIDAAGCSARKATDNRAGDRVVVGKVGNGGTSGSASKPTRGGVLHAASQRQGEKSDKDKRFLHFELPLLVVVLPADSTATSADANRKKLSFTQTATTRRCADEPSEKNDLTRKGPGQGEGKG